MECLNIPIRWGLQESSDCESASLRSSLAVIHRLAAKELQISVLAMSR